jgi:hypothetical protein
MIDHIQSLRDVFAEILKPMSRESVQAFYDVLQRKLEDRDYEHTNLQENTGASR